MKNIVLTSIYLNSHPIHTVSVNEPNKMQIAELVEDSASSLKFEGQITYQDYRDLGSGNKGYTFSVGDKKAVVIIQRLPIIKFEKDSTGYSFTEI